MKRADARGRVDGNRKTCQTNLQTTEGDSGAEKSGRFASCDASSRCAFLLANISVPRSVVFDELTMGQEDAFMYIASRSIFSEINKDITFPPSKIGFVLFLRNGDEEMKNFSSSNSKNSVEDTGMKLKHKERT